MLNAMKFSNTRLKSWSTTAAWLVSCAATAAPVYAQKAAPMPNLSRSPSPLIGFGIIAVFAVLIVAISLLPSKRGHQD